MLTYEQARLPISVAEYAAHQIGNIDDGEWSKCLSCQTNRSCAVLRSIDISSV